MDYNSLPPEARVPFPQRFCNFILRTPCIGTFFLVFYIYTCLPEGSSSGWFAVISIVISLLSFVTTAPATFGTPVAFSVSLFFISDYNENYIAIYAIVTLVAFIMFSLHYIVLYRLASGQYITLPQSGAIVMYPNHPRSHPNSKNGSALCMLVPVVVVLLLVGILFALFSGKDNSHESTPATVSQSSAYSKSNLASYYRNNFPQVWGWISKYADNP